MAKFSTLQFASRADRGAAFGVMNPLDPTAPLLGADGAPSTITILGLDSPTAKRLEYEARAARQAREQARAYGDGDDTTPAPLTAEEIAEDWARTVDKLVAITVGWSGFEDDDGAPLPCTPDHTRALYTQNEAIAYQVLGFYYDRPRFFGGSATPSVPSPTTASDSVAA